MQRITLIFICLLSITIATAQHLTPFVVASAGTDGANGSYHLSWTLGELAIATQIQVDATLLQGFQQPNYLIDRLTEQPEKGYQIKLFPNPTTDWITAEITGSEKAVTGELYDFFGRLIFRKTLEPPRAVLDLSRLPDAAYWLRILDDNNEMLGVWQIHKFR